MFGMTDPGSCAHDLDVASHGPADIAGAVFVRHGALADIGDDFHVGMEVTSKAGAGRDLVVVPDHEGAEAAIRLIALGRNDKVMVRFQPDTVAMMALAAVSVDPNNLLERLQTVSPPTAVSYSTHRRMNLFVHRRRVEVDDASWNLQRQFKRDECRLQG